MRKTISSNMVYASDFPFSDSKRYYSYSFDRSPLARQTMNVGWRASLTHYRLVDLMLKLRVVRSWTNEP